MALSPHQTHPKHSPHGVAIPHRSVFSFSPQLDLAHWLRGSPPIRPTQNKPFHCQRPKPRPLSVYWPSFLQSPTPNFQLASQPGFPCFHSLCHTRLWRTQSGRGEILGGKGAGRGRKVKGTERLSFPLLTRFSTAPGRRCIVGLRRCAREAGIWQWSPLASASCRLQSYLAIPRHPCSPLPPNRLLLHPPVQNGGGGGSGSGDGSSGLPGFVPQLRRSVLLLRALRAAARSA